MKAIEQKLEVKIEPVHLPQQKVQPKVQPKAPGLHGKVYVDGRWGLGAASFHFENDAPYINYENASKMKWKCINGQPPPKRILFEKWNYDPKTRTFTGGINWHLNPLVPWHLYWWYTIIFSPDFKEITAQSFVNCYTVKDVVMYVSWFEKDMFYRLKQN